MLNTQLRAINVPLFGIFGLFFCIRSEEVTILAHYMLTKFLLQSTKIHNHLYPAEKSSLEIKIISTSDVIVPTMFS